MLLAEALEKYRGEDIVVFALPRGGSAFGRGDRQEIGGTVGFAHYQKNRTPIQS